MTLDTGNFYWSGMPLTRVYEVLEQFAPYARHTHVKNIGYPPSERERERELGWRYADFVCPLEEGDIDLERVHRILQEAGYDAGLCIEDESLGRFAPSERREVLRRDVAYLQRILGAYRHLRGIREWPRRNAGGMERRCGCPRGRASRALAGLDVLSRAKGEAGHSAPGAGRGPAAANPVLCIAQTSHSQHRW